MNFGVDQAGAHGVDADALGGDFTGQSDGEGFDGRLGRRIVHRHARRTGFHKRRRQVDDAATRATMAGRHACHGRLRAHEVAHHIGGKHPLKARHIHALHPRIRRDDARVVDQGVQRWAFAVDKGKQGLHLIGLRHIGSHAPGLTAGRLDVFDHGLRGGLIAGVIDANGVALQGQQTGRGRADAAPAASDENGFLHG